MTHIHTYIYIYIYPTSKETRNYARSKWRLIKGTFEMFNVKISAVFNFILIFNLSVKRYIISGTHRCFSSNVFRKLKDALKT